MNPVDPGFDLYMAVPIGREFVAELNNLSSVLIKGRAFVLGLLPSLLFHDEERL